MDYNEKTAILHAYAKEMDLGFNDIGCGCRDFETLVGTQLVFHQ